MPVNVLAVCRLLRDDPSAQIRIEVEVPEEGRHLFDGNYRSAAGEMPAPGEFYRVVDNKRGVELRLYLASTPETVVKLEAHCNVTSNSGLHRDLYPYRINNNELIRRMFREGYRLGLNSPQQL